MTNSTFASNSASGRDACGEDGCASSGSGGCIYNAGTLTVTNSAFTGNSAAGNGIGGGILNEGAALLRNTIVAASPSGGNCSGVIDGGHNLDDGTSCGFSTANGSLSNTDPQLDPAGLRDNGGPTQTVALCTAAGMPAGCTASSPAVDAGDESICAAAPVSNRDQRGFVRPGTGHANCSIGAYEAGASASGACIGDCDASSSVTVDEIITLVNLALGNAQASGCAYGAPGGAEVNVAVIIQAVSNALNGCGVG